MLAFKYCLGALIAFSLLLSLNLRAEESISLKANAPKEYVVKEGETLWELASMYLEDPRLWRQLWKFNPHVDNPDLIYPGDRIQISYTADGQPVLKMGKPEFKYSPQKRILHKRDEPISLLPLNDISVFMSFEQVIDVNLLDSLPYVLGSDKPIKRALPGDLIYVKGDLESHRRFALYRKGRTYVDPESDNEIGHESVLVATANLVNSGNHQEGIPAKLIIDTARQEVKAGDMLMPIRQGQDLPAFFKMRPVKNKIQGSVIATTKDVAGVSKFGVVVINRGIKDGVEPGHVLSVSRQSPKIIDQGLGPKYQEDATGYENFIGSIKALFGSNEHQGVYDMPYEYIGELMLFKVYEQVSYCMVIKNVEPLYVGDRVNNPE